MYHHLETTFYRLSLLHKDDTIPGNTTPVQFAN